MDNRLQEKFSQIFKSNSWGSQESVSGPGSTLSATRNVQRELPILLNQSGFDLILCRDCFFHLSNANIKKALNNFKRSGSKYLLTTTFTWMGLQNNVDIEDGGWRRINLWQNPFNLPMPEYFIVEGNQESGGAQADRILGLWHLGRIGLV